MRWRNSNDRYGGVSQFLHWITVAFLIGSFGLGLSMVDLEFSPRQLQFYAWHKWIGVTVFSITAIRLIWRWLDRAPGLPAEMPLIERLLARGAHAMLYVLLIAMPLTGWVMSSALGVPVVYLGVLPLPDLVDDDRALGEALKAVHWGLSRLFLLLIAIHVLAALYHRFYLRDQVLDRMVPWKG